MGFLDSLMGKGGKWFDCGKNLSAVSGTLSRLPAPRIGEDGVVSAHLVPDDKSVLANRNGKRNQNDMLELKVQPPPNRAQAFLDALKSMADKKVMVSGALVNDDAKEGKAELYPVDAVWMRLPVDMYPEWMKGMMTTMKDPNAEVHAFRLAAASDARKGGVPAPAASARKIRINFPYPAKANVPNPEIKYEIKPTANVNVDFQFNNEAIRERMELVFELHEAKSQEGPSLFVADFMMFWNQPMSNR